MMESKTWIDLIEILVTSGILVSIYEAVRWWRQDRKKKDNSVTESDVKAQKEQIDLGTTYISKINEISNMLLENTKQTLQSKELNDEISKDVKSIKAEQSMIVAYLNGGYAEFKANGGKKTNKKAVSVAD